jgi:hypothetical protein
MHEAADSGGFYDPTGSGRKHDMKKQNEKEGTRRILGRRLARELSPEDMKMVMGGTTSCSPCADDCDQDYQA